jgi:hypothetical protein
MECGENRQSDPEIAQAEHGISAKSPSDNTRAANTCRRREGGGLVTREERIMTRKNDGAQPPADVHDPSFSLRDED